MPSKYNRKNRDRKGGHKTTPVTGHDFDFKVFAGPVMRADIKRITKKLARRQAKTAIAQAIAWEAIADEQFEVIEIAESYPDDFWDDWNDLQEEEEPGTDYYDDFYRYDPFEDFGIGDQYDYFECTCHYCVTDRARRDTQTQLRYEAVRSTDAGKSLATLLEERGIRL